MTAKTHRKRTLASAITYRVVSTVALAFISYFVSGKLFDSAIITVTYAVIATILFYVNDRAWERTDWGRKEAHNSGPYTYKSTENEEDD